MRNRVLIGSWRACLLGLLILSSSTAFSLDPHRDLRQYGHRTWQTDSGLPQNTVHAIAQTHDGYIWLATDGGLVRFDGAEFAVYDKQAPAHLRSANINSLFEDHEGNLWIGTDDCLVRRHGSEFTTFSVADGLPSNTIWSVFETHGGADRSGSLWVVTSNGLARRANSRFQPFPVAGGIAGSKSVVEASDGSLWIGTHAGLAHLRNDRTEAVPQTSALDVQAIAATPDGHIWVGTRAGLFSFASGNLSLGQPLAALPSNEITALKPAKNGGLWIGTAKGVAVLRNGAITTWTTPDGQPADRVESIYEDREGATWIAADRGIRRVANGRVEAFTGQSSLASELVLAIFEDREGSLWLGTESGGLDMLHDQKFTAYTTSDGLSDNLVRSVVQDNSSAIWIGTNGGGLDRFKDGAFTSLTTSTGLTSNIVLALASDSLGTLWVGTPDGLNIVRNGKVARVFTSADGLADDFVRSLYPASDGSLWIGTRRGLSHLQNGRFVNYSSLDGLGSDLVGAMVEDERRTLWIATLGGLSRFDEGKFTTLTMRDYLSSNVITALHASTDGTLWIGTNNGGLNRLREGKITAYSPDATHLPESIYAVLEDASSNLWLASKTGIYRVAIPQLDDFADGKLSAIDPASYGTADGMKIDECSSGGHPAAWKLIEGAMWFATLRGIAVIDPAHLLKNTIPPPVAIEQVLIDDQPVDPSNALVVSPGRSHFEFHYAGLSFIAPQKVRYRYKLNGFDHDWVDAGTRRIAYYTNLPPGRYSFRVLASNNDGVWNETGAFVDLQLRPHFYQTYWFYTLLLLSLAMLAYCIYRWRLRQAELRFAAVLSERGRIAREIHDGLAQGLVGISVQLELVNRLLASSIESARAQLDHARSLVKESLTEARSSIWDLRSQAAETEDLATRLSRMANLATERSMPRIRVKSSVSGTYRPLPPKAEAELLRIAQEAVTNAVRHAKPEHIAIELRFGVRDLHMTIQDDGCGFDGQPHPQSFGPAGHFGLTGMRERAKEIGGTLVVESTPGKGTQVSVNVAIDS
jgi:ligand-binding sensor domain-containing protein/signal transduction histidine kinase